MWKKRRFTVRPEKSCLNGTLTLVDDRVRTLANGNTTFYIDEDLLARIFIRQ